MVGGWWWWSRKYFYRLGVTGWAILPGERDRSVPEVFLQVRGYRLGDTSGGILRAD